ncbi:dihydrolipoyl dehydrogenase [Paenibacillus abyssi]|uniref:Dihydrolipoyl dehydrogenase n=1 Tax=Paenibacillus abyssi TaxID=1340531 RepID=A0A917D6E4_9BACL|nr:dihydrolipoyl dehydrogenase [Paenibacillus abyssi]GGG13601.1 dihydrolipoyl dehydrogenase [Paenibacillus abyssi]
MDAGNAVVEIDVVVIGAGPGGYTAAIRAAQLGRKVLVIEKGSLGGVCLNVGCIPSKILITAAERFELLSHSDEMGVEAEQVSFNFSKLLKRKHNVIQTLTSGVGSLLKGYQVQVVHGEARFIGSKELIVCNGEYSTSYRFNHCIIAAGSRPAELPGLPFGDKVLSSTDALSLDKLPERLIVVGGGYIGIELGQAFAKLGTKVTTLEAGATILPGFDKRMANMVSRNMKKAHADIYTGANVKRITTADGEVIVMFDHSGEEKQITADYVLVSVGRMPNTDQLGLEAAGVEANGKGYIEVDRQCRTNVSHIYAIGDIVPGPALAHKAAYEGKVAAEAIAGERRYVDYRCIPAVVFSDPELAAVGLTEQAAHKSGYDAMVGNFSYGANGRALTLNAAAGMVTLVGDKKTGAVLGAQIAGPEASNLIAEITLAIEMGASFEDIALTIHAHPTLGEMIMEAAENGLGQGIHSLH